MPEIKIVKQITIGSETRDIGAKYDEDKNEIKTTYAKAGTSYTKEESDGKYATDADLTTLEATVNTDCIKTTGLEGALRTFFINNPGFTVPATINKSIDFITDSSISLNNSEENPYQIIKVIVCAADSIGDTETVVIKLDENESDGLARSFIEEGATYEVYKRVLVGKNIDGDASVYMSSNNSWGTFSLRIFTNGEPSTKKVTFMIYKEGWPENNSGGAQ